MMNNFAPNNYVNFTFIHFDQGLDLIHMLSVHSLFVMSYKVFAHENDMCLFEIYKSFICDKKTHENLKF
jgi:hypothetical protein